MKGFLLILGMIAVVVGILAFGVWWQIYRFHDCRHVGHSMLYCVMTIGR